MSSPTPTAPALVTGASRGIGRAVARRLARDGFPVVATARDRDRLEELRAECAAHGQTVGVVAADLAEPRAPERIVAAANAQLGEPLGILINNAGTAPAGRIEDTGDTVLGEALQLHVSAPLALVRAVLPAMRERESGCIVNLASTAGLRGFPFTAAYTAAKHGMVGLSRAFAAELKTTGIAVYAVCPGFVDTDITRGAAAAVAARGKTSADEALERMAAQNRIGRMHSVDEVADTVAWLCEQRPSGCVYDLDSSPPTFVDSP